MIKIDSELVSNVSAKAKNAGRKRMNHNFHQEQNDTLQRMLNAMEPGTYVRPHRHVAPVKREAFVILRGRIAFIEFDDFGTITESCIMDAARGCYGAEITPGAFHTLVSLEPGSVLYELKDGPYDADTDKEFADWAPEEGSVEAVEYVKGLRGKMISENNT